MQYNTMTNTCAGPCIRDRKYAGPGEILKGTTTEGYYISITSNDIIGICSIKTC